MAEVQANNIVLFHELCVAFLAHIPDDVKERTGIRHSLQQFESSLHYVAPEIEVDFYGRFWRTYTAIETEYAGAAWLVHMNHAVNGAWYNLLLDVHMRQKQLNEDADEKGLSQ